MAVPVRKRSNSYIEAIFQGNSSRGNNSLDDSALSEISVKAVRQSPANALKRTGNSLNPAITATPYSITDAFSSETGVDATALRKSDLFLNVGGQLMSGSIEPNTLSNINYGLNKFRDEEIQAAQRNKSHASVATALSSWPNIHPHNAVSP